MKQAISLGLKVPWATYFLGNVENIKAIGTDDDAVGSVGCERYQETIPGEGNKKVWEWFYKKYGIYPT
jgi:hypothetical protein